MPHFSLAPVSSPHVSACPICPSCLSLPHLPLMSQPVPFAPSQFPSYPRPPAVSSPHVSACPQSVPLMSQLAPYSRPPVALPACPVSVSTSLYFVGLNYSLVIIGRESYFMHLFCGETVLATSNDIHRLQLWFFTFE